MKLGNIRSMAGWLAALFFVCTAADGAGAELTSNTVQAEWNFERAGDLQGWQPNGHLSGVVVSNGILACRAVGADPMLEFRPPMSLKTSPWQQLEVRLKTDRDGTGEFFWSNVSTGRFGGFIQDKTTRFNVAGDSQWHTYRLLPFWHPEGKIVRLRFDLYDGAKFEIDSIRITELAVPAPVKTPDFDFTRGELGWRAVHEARLAAGPQGLTLSTPARDSFALSPPLRIEAEEQGYISICLAANRGSHGTLFLATEQKHGLKNFSFPIEADGREHVYNIDMTAANDWRGQIIALALHPGTDGKAEWRVRWLKVSAQPQGPPQLKVLTAALDGALPRVGVPVNLSATVANAGGEPAQDIRADWVLPEGVRILKTMPPPQAALEPGEEAVWTWQVQADKDVSGEASITLSAKRTDVTARTTLHFTPRLAVPRTGYVPEPKPVRGPYEVGVYYFPGWHDASRWQPLQPFPERRPVLGWYREGDPEVADWHIKWAVEHGITFFAYDWYWSQGSRSLEHALHNGYFKSRYHHLLKFCLLWANHNPAHTSTHEDCLAVTRYWIENYFRRPEHLTIDGKPVMIIFSTHRLTDDLGSPGVKKAFEAMRAECRQAGLKGLYLVACVGDAGGARRAAEEGYDSISAYNWPGLGMTGGGNRAPFETLVPAYRRHWEHLLAQSPIPLQPIPVCGGWDSRPWHGENNLVRYGRTPELFKRHLLDAKEVLENPARKQAGQKLVLVEAWNEWGEGSYIEPHQEFGFGYLDAIREVFTAAPKTHADVTPADAGLGPYDVPPLPPGRTAWDFQAGREGWNSTMGLADVSIRNGALSGRTTDRDPAFFGPAFEARATKFKSVVIRLKLHRATGELFKDVAQLFWRTGRFSESEATSARFAVNGDGQWHDYVVPVSQNPRWRGMITGLRLDPCSQPGVEVEIKSIRLE